MFKWIVLIIILAVGGYAAYDRYMAGHHTRPKMPEGSFSLSYKSGLRGIVVDVLNDEENRRYLGFPMEVPFYLKEAWAWCHPPTEQESAEVANFMAERDWPGQRFEAICKVTVEGEDIVRGIILSVPRL